MENGQLTDPAHWAVADVVNYFKATGFEDQANAFQDQVELVIIFLKSSKVFMTRIFTEYQVGYFSIIHSFFHSGFIK